MEIIVKKLQTCSNNAAAQANVFSQVVQMIHSSKDSSKEINFLKEKCCENNKNISRLASQTLLLLVEENILSADELLEHFLVVISTNQTIYSAPFLINGLLLSKNRQQKRYNLHSPQHPLIQVLLEYGQSWRSIFNEIKFTLDINYESSSNNLLIYWPFIKYVICDPTNVTNCQLKEDLWELLISIPVANYHFDSLLQWTQLNQDKTLELNSQLLCRLINIETYDKQLLLLLQMVSLHNLVLFHLDPRPVVTGIEDTLEECDAKHTRNAAILFLAKTISICGLTYLPCLLNACDALLCGEPVSQISLLSLKASLLLWTANECPLTENVCTRVAFIICLIDGKLIGNRRCSRIRSFWIRNKELMESYHELHWCVKMCLTIEQWRTPAAILDWLEQLMQCRVSHAILQHIVLLQGLFLLDDPPIQCKVMELVNSKLSEFTHVLNLFGVLSVSALSTSLEPNVHWTVLKNLSNMHANSNLPLLPTLVHAFQTNKASSASSISLHLAAVRLMLDLWRKDNRQIGPLEKYLAEPRLKRSVQTSWQAHVMDAFVLYSICWQQPERHGKDVVVHLSNILSECKDRGAISLALDGIAQLCQSEIIDAISTWNALKPMLVGHPVANCTAAVCQLIGSFASLPYMDACTQFLYDCLDHLWALIDQKTPDATIPALKALANFKAEDMLERAKILSRNEEIANENYDAMYQRTSLKTETHIFINPNSDSLWLDLIRDNANNHLIINSFEEFLTSLAVTEIANFLRNVYQVTGHREPQNYNYLPSQSVVRNLGHFVVTECCRWRKNSTTYLCCLRILGCTEFSKPLPPVDWSFMQELLHEPETKNLCLDILSHQTRISGTARRLIENYLDAIIQNHQDIDSVLQIYKNLRYLANSIQPSLFAPFVGVTLTYAIAQSTHYDQSDAVLIMTICDSLGSILKDANILEPNKVTICQIIAEKLYNIQPDSWICEALLTTISSAPIDIVDATVLSVQSISYTKNIRLRGAMMRSSSVESGPNFKFLNDLYCFETVRYKTLLLNEVRALLNTDYSGKYYVPWIRDLFGQIQVFLANDPNKSDVIEMMCDVLILAVVILSGNGMFVCDSMYPNTHELFPNALVDLLDITEWYEEIGHVLESVYFLNKHPSLSATYQKLFGSSLKALRGKEEFTKNSAWMRYMDSS